MSVVSMYVPKIKYYSCFMKWILFHFQLKGRCGSKREASRKTASGTKWWLHNHDSLLPLPLLINYQLSSLFSPFIHPSNFVPLKNRAMQKQYIYNIIYVYIIETMMKDKKTNKEEQLESGTFGLKLRRCTLCLLLLA